MTAEKYFADPNIHRNYDFDSGVFNNIIQPAQQGFGEQYPAQPAQPHHGGGGGGPDGYVTEPTQIGQTDREAQDEIMTYKVWSI